MKNRGLIITYITILSIFVVALIAFMIFGSKLNFRFRDNSVVILNESLDSNKKVTVKVKNYDIVIKENNEDNIHIVVEGSEDNKNEIIIDSDSNNINITQESTHACFGFCYYANKVTIYVPESFTKSLDLFSTSGDINILNNLNSDNHTIKTTSGDIDINNIRGSSIKSTSGEITIHEGKDINALTTSGDITIFKAENSLDINSTSGEIEIKNLTGFITSSSTSGDITINDFTITNNSSINSRSGEVMIRLQNEARITAKTTSGDKDIKNTDGEYSLDLSTTSGDIVVK